MFYELATLSRPIRPAAGLDNWVAWRKAQLFLVPDDPRNLRADLTLDLVQLIMAMLQKDPSKRPASWTDIASRAKGSHMPVEGRPNVRTLVERATSTFNQRTAATIREHEERERHEEKTSLLEQAFDEVAAVLRAIVQAFNEESAVGKLELKVLSPFLIQVRSHASNLKLDLTGRPHENVPIGTGGVACILATVRLDPAPSPPNEAAYHDQTSFGSFHLVYRLSKAGDRYGAWFQLRFGFSPLLPKASYPHWFAVEWSELPRELQILNAFGHYKHEQRPFDDEWLKMLLAQML